jgi:hypothetical protein
VLLATSAAAPLQDALAGSGELVLPLAWAAPSPAAVAGLHLVALRPTGVASEAWRGYIQAVDRSFGVLTGHDLREMTYVARVLWASYAGPVARREVPSLFNLAELRRRAEPAFAAMRTRLLQRDSQMHAHERAARTSGAAGGAALTAPPPAPPAAVGAAAGAAAAGGANGSGARAAGSRGAPAAATTAPSPSPLLPTPAAPLPPTRRERDLLLELPYYPRLALLAAFCASANPPDTDARYFSRRATGRRRSAEGKGRSAMARRTATALLTGPRAFTLERLLGVFRALVHAHNETPVAESQLAHADLQSALTSLVELHLLVPASGPDELDTPRYRCALPLESAGALAGVLGLDLGKYLHDVTAS